MDLKYIFSLEKLSLNLSKGFFRVEKKLLLFLTEIRYQTCLFFNKKSATIRRNILVPFTTNELSNFLLNKLIHMK